MSFPSLDALRARETTRDNSGCMRQIQFLIEIHFLLLFTLFLAAIFIVLYGKVPGLGIQPFLMAAIRLRHLFPEIYLN